jgi:DNA-binding CsgD family transcriptional regulator
MLAPWAVEAARLDLVRLGHAGLDSRNLRKQTLVRLRRLIPFDAAFFAMCDPATLLFTDGLRQDMPPESTPRFVEDEFLRDDFNKWIDLARSPLNAGALELASGGDLSESYRYREILEPLGFGDELRGVMAAGGACWGLLCLHREAGARSFAPADVAALNALTQAIAAGLRVSLLSEAAAAEQADVGVVLLNPDLSLAGVSAGAEPWLAELAGEARPGAELPSAVLAVAGRLLGLEADASGPPARARMRAPSGRWLTFSASRLMQGGCPGPIAVTVAATPALELAEVIMRAYALTERERELASHVLRGRSTKQLAAELGISELTVQQHIKSIYAKTGCSSRGELAAQLLGSQYIPRARRGTPLAPSGWFSE